MPESAQFAAQPSEINTDRHLWNSFDHAETEISAVWIVRFCKDRGQGWEPFSEAEIESYYRANSRYQGFSFNRLIDPGMAFYIQQGYVSKGGGWIVRLPDGRLQVTEDFVNRCGAAAIRQRVKK